MSPSTAKAKSKKTRNRGTLTGEAVSFRPTIRVRDRLDKGAKQSQRTISSELNNLVERALDVENRVAEDFRRAFGDEKNYALGYLVARIATGVTHECKADWSTDASARAQLAGCLHQLADLIATNATAVERGSGPDVIVTGADGSVTQIRCKSSVPANRVFADVVHQLAAHSRLFWPLVVTAGNSDNDAKIVPPTEDLAAILICGVPNGAGR